MKIALAQYNFLIGDFQYNQSKILSGINIAIDEGADLVVFPELALTGYPPRDFLEFDDFITRCEDHMRVIASHCKSIAAIVGSPSRNNTGKGKPLFNSAWFLNNGKVESIANKSLLPNYDVFDEYRYFEPSNKFSFIDYRGKRLVLTVCEDIWNTSEVPMYSFFPLDQVNSITPDIIINISASPFNYNQSVLRKEVLKANALKYGKPIVYVNHTGAQTELIFDGNSMVCDAAGNIRNQLPYFEEAVKVIEITDDYFNAGDRNPDLQHIPEKTATKPHNTFRDEPPVIQLIHDALVLGIKDYFNKMGFRKAVLGLSGGIDSAVTLVLAAEALGPDNVHAVLLPSVYSSGHSISDARQLAENMKCPYDIIPIKYTVAAFESTLSPLFKQLPPDITEENIQARARAVILMALSNKFGYILLNTSNKSEAAVGYGTLYGDMCGGLSVLGDVYKTDVYKLAEFINAEKEIIPLNTITKPPSAELRPDQKDTDSLPDYELLDQVLYSYIEMKRSPSEMILMGFNESIVKRVVGMVNRSEWKRYQTPPILRISPKAFGMGRRMPIVARYLT
ncbi:MAG TPA: NAD+ synthase [Lentimicrobium sp.]|nr:NAD+ synthase [Lentimicrobium sp.]